MKLTVMLDYSMFRGGDDLLPIFSYVVLKTQHAQLVAECHAMEEFIHERYDDLFCKGNAVTMCL